MKKETRFWVNVLMVTIAISVVFVMIFEAERGSLPLMAQSIQATTTTYVSPVCDSDGGCPESERDLIRAQSPLHRCAATMADISIGAVVDVYNVNFGQMVDDGVITTDPYPVTSGSLVEYAVGVNVDGEVDQRLLSELGLVPYMPRGIWNRANFTVLSGAYCPESLP